MNPLGTLPVSNSPQFSLSKVDWQKLARLVLVQLLALAVSEAPKLAGYTYVWNGTDYTVQVVLVINTLAEMTRRFLAGQPR